MPSCLPLVALMVFALVAPAQHRPPHTGTQSQNANRLLPVPVERASDTYAIYSLLTPGSSADTISPRQIHNWVVADTTVNITDMDPAVPPKGELKAPPENVRAFNEAVRDFDTRRYDRFRLDRDRSHAQLAYSLANEQEVNDLRRSGSTDSGITFFSAVYFNSTQNAALVYVNDWCANLCSAGQWVYLEKQGGEWTRRSGIVTGGA